MFHTHSIIIIVNVLPLAHCFCERTSFRQCKTGCYKYAEMYIFSYFNATFPSLFKFRFYSVHLIRQGLSIYEIVIKDSNVKICNMLFTSTKTFFVPGFIWLMQSDTIKHREEGYEFSLSRSFLYSPVSFVFCISKIVIPLSVRWFTTSHIYS